MDPSLELTLLYRGAEADLFTYEMGPWTAVLKKRVRKTYRSMELDKRIRKERTAREALAMHTAKQLGVRTPTLLEVNSSDCSISMTFIHGDSARNGLDSISPSDSRVILRDLGRQVGLLHNGDIVHGDLTTSNILIDRSLKTHMIDFGMSSHTDEAEDMGVDLHLLERSIATSHTGDTGASMRAFSEGYTESVGGVWARAAFKKAVMISKRGRYFALR
jgi:Kae1-associated kinase Bud32